MKSVLITGANRGLGLGIVKFLLKNNCKSIFAACRNTDNKELNALATEYKQLHIVELDLEDPSSFDTFSQKISSVVKEDGLNVLFNNGGVSTKFTKLGLVKEDQLMQNFRVNTVAPILLTKSMLPLLKKASSNNNNIEMGINRAAVINMSSVLGSIEMNSEGGFYPYRCSKAALNATTKSMSIEMKKDKIFVISMHPGWVKTDMGGPRAPLEIEESITDIFSTLGRLKEKDTGNFYQHDGKQLPW